MVVNTHTNTLMGEKTLKDITLLLWYTFLSESLN